MSWGLKVNNVFLPRVSKEDIQERHAENERLVQYYRDRLLQLATATPRDFEEDYWEDRVLKEVDELVSNLAEAAGANFILAQAKGRPDDVEAY